MVPYACQWEYPLQHFAILWHSWGFLCLWIPLASYSVCCFPVAPLFCSCLFLLPFAIFDSFLRFSLFMLLRGPNNSLCLAMCVPFQRFHSFTAFTTFAVARACQLFRLFCNSCRFSLFHCFLQPMLLSLPSSSFCCFLQLLQLLGIPPCFCSVRGFQHFLLLLTRCFLQLLLLPIAFRIPRCVCNVMQLVMLSNASRSFGRVLQRNDVFVTSNH